MDGEAVRELAERLGHPIEVGGFISRPDNWTTEDPASLVKPGPLATAFAVSTLGAVRDYLTANRDVLSLDRLMVHVASPSRVNVTGPIMERSRARETFLTATAADLTEGFLGKFMPLEDFIIGMQVRFADANDRNRILSLLSNVKHETVKTALDDGVTQIVQARAGVALVSDVAVPNPVLLTGYRTFRDTVQPNALYVLRVQSGKAGGLPEAALFESDGGAWKLTAIQRIAEWLSMNVPSGVSVLA